MKIYKILSGVIIEDDAGKLFYKEDFQWDQLINRDGLYHYLSQFKEECEPIDYLPEKLLAPIGSQEIWAAGVTYLRSRNARMEESKQTGGATFYDKVYDADRPEIFFKSTPQRCVGQNDYVRIRKDSTWNVPEPELTLFINSNKNIVGYTIGNDMSSRSIEGENPLYLPQAKCYEKSAAIGPCIYVPSDPIDPSTLISIQIIRKDAIAYEDKVQISQMKRKHSELVDFLYKECEFPNGCFLMTGTCLVPPNEFTLRSGDVVKISISNIGTLVNTVE